MINGLGWLTITVALLHIVATYGTGQLYYGVLYNSDAMFIPVLFRTLVEHGAWQGWDLPTSPFLFPDAALFFPILALTPEIHLATLLFGVAQLLLIVLGLLLLQRQLFGTNLLAQASTFLTATLGLWLIASGKQIFYPLALMSVHHMGVLLVLPFTTVALLRSLQVERTARQRHGSLFFLLALTLLTVHSESLFIVHFVLPALVALLLWGKSQAMPWRRLLRLAGGLLLAAVAGQWLRQFLVPVDKLLSYARTEEGAMAASAANFGTWLNQVIHADRPFVALWLISTLALIVLFAICLRQLLLRQERPTTRPVAMVTTLALGAMVISVAAALVSGNFKDDFSTRYILPTLYLPLFLGIPLAVGMVYATWEQGQRVSQRVSQRGMIATTLLLLFAIGALLITLPPVTLASMTTYQDPFMACLQRESAQRNIRRGVANFWQATSITALSEGKLEVMAVGDDLAPFIWNNNRLRYQPPFEFVLIDEESTQEGVLHPETVVAKFGEPAASFTCASSVVLVYNRPEDLPFRRWFATSPAFAQLSQVGDYAEFYGYTLRTNVEGVAVGLSLGASEQWDQEEGLLAYLPLKQLPPGRYGVAIDLYTDYTNAAAWEVVAITPTERLLILSEDITSAGKSVITGTFALSMTADVDIGVKYGGEGAVFVDRVRVAHLAPAQSDLAHAFPELPAPVDELPSDEATLRLLYPHAATATANNEVDFVWQWSGPPLPQEQTFEVRLWPQGETIHYGAHDAAASVTQIRQIGDTYILRLDLNGAHSVMQHGAGEYEWTVGIVAIEPAYQDLQREATPNTLRVAP